MRLKRAVLGMSAAGIAAVAPIALAAGCTEDDNANKTVWEREIGGSTDTGSRNDFSFNNQAFDVVKAFTNNENRFVENQGLATDIKASYQTLALSGVKTILAAGFDHGPEIIKALKDANFPKDIKFILLDSEITAAGLGAGYEGEASRVLNINYKAEQVGFEVGFISAAKAVMVDPVNPVVATYGGVDFPAVSSFMAGFQQGTKYYNDTLSPTKKVSFFKAGPSRPDYFKGNFNAKLSSDERAKTINWFKDEGANAGSVDVLFPVAGPQGQTILDWLNEFKATPPAGATAAWDKKFVVGVDADLAKRNSNNPSVLTSALKNIATTLTAALNTLYSQSFAVPAGYQGLTPTITKLFNDLAGNTPSSIFGKSILGGISDGFVGVPLETEANLATLIGQTAADAWAGAKTAATNATITFDPAFEA